MTVSAWTITQIQWLDSAGPHGGGWVSIDDIDSWKPIVIDSVGFVVKEDAEAITISCSVHPDQYYNPLSIPKAAILEREDTKIETST